MVSGKTRGDGLSLDSRKVTREGIQPLQPCDMSEKSTNKKLKSIKLFPSLC